MRADGRIRDGWNGCAGARLVAMGLTMGLVVASCTLEASNRGGAGDPEGSSAAPIAIGLLVASTADLPSCTRSSVGQVAYVVSPSGLFRCGIAEGLLAWKAIPCADRDVGTGAYASAQSLLVACIAARWTAVALPMGEQGPAGPAGLDGSNGAAGTSSLVALGEEPVGAHCAYGGVRVDSGLDSDGDGLLEPSEIASTAYVCAGAPGPEGPAGPSEESLAGLAGTACTSSGRTGTLVVEVDSTTGVVTLRCEVPAEAGDGTLGALCRSDGTCESGLRCLSGVCLAHCASDADCTALGTADESSVCWPTAQGQGACTLPCVATSADASGCREGSQCTVDRNPTSGVYVTTCIAASAPTDTTCTLGDPTCGPGLVCGGDLGCLAICDDPSGGQCASGVCTVLAGSRYGVCEP